jgi:glucose/arabinose dehydrogenase
MELLFRFRSPALRPGSRKALACTLLVAALGATSFGCYAVRPSAGGGKTSFTPPRIVNPGDVAVPQGYRIDAVATGLTFPTGVGFDDQGRVYVLEAGYSYGEVWTTPRLLRLEPGGGLTVVAMGDKGGPWTGLDFHGGSFYVAEGGQLDGGRLLQVSMDGKTKALVEGLPSKGDHHANGPAAGRDGWIYFSVGTATNSGIVGEDNFQFGWLRRNPSFHDVPCQDVTASGKNYPSKDVLKPGSEGEVSTGPFSPFGTPVQENEVIRGRLPCSGAVFRVRPAGGTPELVAWGFRNPFGLAFSPDGRLYVTDNQYDERGSRPIYGAGDLLWPVENGTWYGWPDFHGDTPVAEGERYKMLGKEPVQPVLAKHPGTPPKPAAVLGVHASANGFDFSREAAFGHVGEAFIALFGDQAPTTGKVLSPVGFKVVRVDVRTGTVTDFAANRGKEIGPASRVGGAGLERPVAARFGPDGMDLYVVDFGVMTVGKEGPAPRTETGVLWKISRSAEGSR